VVQQTPRNIQPQEACQQLSGSASRCCSWPKRSSICAMAVSGPPIGWGTGWPRPNASSTGPPRTSRSPPSLAVWLDGTASGGRSETRRRRSQGTQWLACRHPSWVTTPCGPPPYDRSARQARRQASAGRPPRRPRRVRARDADTHQHADPDAPDVRSEGPSDPATGGRRATWLRLPLRDGRLRRYGECSCLSRSLSSSAASPART
jgi:hypothetical protein